MLGVAAGVHQPPEESPAGRSSAEATSSASRRETVAEARASEADARVANLRQGSEGLLGQLLEEQRCSFESEKSELRRQIQELSAAATATAPPPPTDAVALAAAESEVLQLREEVEERTAACALLEARRCGLFGMHEVVVTSKGGGASRRQAAEWSMELSEEAVQVEEEV